MDLNEGHALLEEDLFKLPCKELKKMARKSNVNPNFKKADLIKALIRSSVPASLEGIALQENTTTKGRMTRSRASIMPFSDTEKVSSDKAIIEVCSENVNSAVIDKGVSGTGTNKTRKRRKQEPESECNSDKSLSDMFKVISSIQPKEKPLREITNKTNSLVSGVIKETLVEENKTVSKKSRKSKGQTNNTPNHENVSEPSSDTVKNINQDKSYTSGVSQGAIASCTVGKGSKNKTRSKVKAIKKEKDKDVEIKIEVVENNSCDVEIGKEVCSALKVDSERKQRKRNRSEEKSKEDENCDILMSKETYSVTAIETKRKPRKRNRSDEKNKDGEIIISERLSSQPVAQNKRKPRKQNKSVEKNSEIQENMSSKEKRNSISLKTVIVESDEPCEENKIEMKQSNVNKNVSGIDLLSEGSPHDLRNDNTQSESIRNSLSVSSSNRSSRSTSRINTTNGNSTELGNSQGNCANERPSQEDVEKFHKMSEIGSGDSTSTNPEKESTEPDMPVPVPLRRRSTFTLDKFGGKKSVGTPETTKAFDPPKRSNTFTIDENAEESSTTRRASLHFVADPNLVKNSALSKLPSKGGKSIGKRIMTAVTKQSSPKSTSKLGSSMKKTITKGAQSPGSALRQKVGSARKAPDFKNIHQKLFGNMESVSDNHHRKLERAKALLQSPAPRCAIMTPSPRSVSVKETKSPKHLHVTKIPSSFVFKTRSPKTRTSLQSSSLAPFTFSNGQANVRTPTTTQKQTKAPQSIGKPAINRFGFKTRINKVEATAIAGKKLPPVSMEKKKDQDRKILQGVRTNKRFLLQMQMREKQQQ